MIRYLARKEKSANSLLGRFTAPHPERLGDLARAPDLDAHSVDFSHVVSSIRIGNIHKLTSPDRLTVANQVLGSYLKNDNHDSVRLLDVGGSDGVTTLDAVRQLESELGISVSATLTDRYIHLIHYAHGIFHEYRMPDGSPVWVRIGPFGLQLSSLNSSRDPVTRLLGRWYLSRETSRQAMSELESFLLVNPAVVSDPAITLVEWNALEKRSEWQNSFEAVRAANLLNESYFSREEIESMLRHMHSYIVADGLLIVTRNHIEKQSETERGSLWRRSSTGFNRLEDFGGGSGVGHMVDEIRVVT